MANNQGIRGIRQTIPSGYMIGRQSPGSSKGAPGLIPLPPLNQQPIIAGAGGKATQGSGQGSGGSSSAAIVTVTAGTGINVSGAPAYTVSLQVPVTVADGGTNAITASGTSLDNITGFSSTGFLERTGAGAYTFIANPLPIANGGTNATSASGTSLDNITGFSSTGYLKRTGAGTYSFVADGTSHQVLHGGGTFSQVDLTADVTGVLPTANGGKYAAGQVPGTATNDNASAGNVGEYITTTVTETGGSQVSLTSPNQSTIITLSLTAGDWDVFGNIHITEGVAGNVTQLEAGINTTATLPLPGTGVDAFIQLDTPLTANPKGAWPTGTTRVSLASSGSAYLLCKCVFGASTVVAYGTLSARRAR